LEKCFQLFGEIKKHLSDNLLILPTYEIAQAQKAVDILDSKISNAATSAKSKKKFSFKSKKTTITAPESSESNTSQQNQVLEPQGLNVVDDSYSLVGLQQCDIYLCDNIMKALRISDLSDCNIYCGAVQGSVLILNCRGCKFMLAAQQIRIHTSSNCDFYVAVRSKPIIEQCHQVRFAPYSFNFPSKDEHWQNMNFKDDHQNLWSQAEDFDWLKSTQSPNWTTIPEDQRVSVTIPHLPSEKIQPRNNT